MIFYPQNIVVGLAEMPVVGGQSERQKSVVLCLSVGCVAVFVKECRKKGTS
jgi:hypothetical protein